ncbi:MAG TPA: EamA family transporter [Bacillota bacterium]|nr:EamA family transporter [Bacillota bacterium]
MRLPPFNPYIAVVIGVISVSTSAVLVKLASGVPASIIANYRLFIAAILMAPIIIMKYRHELRLIQTKDWALSILAGLFLVTHFILWFESLNYTSVASSVVIVALQPIFAFLGTYLFFSERFTPGTFISMMIALIGSIIIGWGDFQLGGMAFFGDILALFGAMAMTGYFLVGQNVRKRLSLMTYTFVVYGIGALILIVYNVILQHPLVGYPLENWWVFLALAVIPTFLGHTLFNWALRWLRTATVSMGVVFEPVGASILAYFILDESITWAQWLGGSIVIIGLFLFIVGTTRKRHVTISKKQGN